MVGDPRSWGQLVGLPPAALARWSEGLEKRRALARALHNGPRPRCPEIAERLATLRDQIAEYRARAIALHARLVELEAQGEDVAALRRTLISSSVRLEQVVRELVEASQPAREPALRTG